MHKATPRSGKLYSNGLIWLNRCIVYGLEFIDKIGIGRAGRPIFIYSVWAGIARVSFLISVIIRSGVIREIIIEFCASKEGVSDAIIGDLSVFPRIGHPRYITMDNEPSRVTLFYGNIKITARGKGPIFLVESFELYSTKLLDGQCSAIHIDVVEVIFCGNALPLRGIDWAFTCQQSGEQFPFISWCFAAVQESVEVMAEFFREHGQQLGIAGALQPILIEIDGSGTGGIGSEGIGH